MTKRLMQGTALALAIALAGLYLFREPLREFAMARLTSDMFVPADRDDFDPGLPVGASLPALRAVLQGREITRLDAFMGTRGLALFVNRSVDW